MVKTSGVRAILYVNNIGDEDEVTEKIRHKEGVDELVIVRSENDLVDAVSRL
jgi:hypothetical protein